MNRKLWVGCSAFVAASIGCHSVAVRPAGRGEPMPALTAVLRDPTGISVDEVRLSPSIEVLFEQQASRGGASVTANQAKAILAELRDVALNEMNSNAAVEPMLISYADTTQASKAPLRVICVLDSIDVTSEASTGSGSAFIDAVTSSGTSQSQSALIACTAHLELIINGVRESAASATGDNRSLLASASSVVLTADSSNGKAETESKADFALNGSTKNAVSVAVQGAWARMWSKYVNKEAARAARLGGTKGG
jgi:hypothetical protein